MSAINSNPFFSFSWSNLDEYLSSHQGRYLFHYLKGKNLSTKLSAKTCVLEEKYIDKDYMIDYQRFYSRSFDYHDKFTKRIHFFSEDFSRVDFKEALENNSIGDLMNSKSYLGFVVIRPIKNSEGKWLIGRTLLKTYPEEVNGGKRVFVKNDYDASLFGIPLSVESLPFQVQDQGVSMCATIALWTAFHPLCDTFDIVKHSPAEITEVATSFRSELRAIPSGGLTFLQMINYVRSTGLDIEVLNVKDVEDDRIITTAVKAYIKEAKLPLIAVLKMKKDDKEDWHAVVISGYRSNSSREVKELYVHDDTIGPYSRVKPDGDFKFWENEWTIKRGYDEVALEKLLIPVYPKLRLTFARINRYYIAMKERINRSEPYIYLGLYLTTVQGYKKSLLESQINDKMDVLITSLPRFLWIIRAYEDNQLIWDRIYDGTSVYARTSFLMHVAYGKTKI